MSETVVSIAGKKKKRFSDFADPANILDGTKQRIDEILNREIEVIGYRVTRSKYAKNRSGECLTLQYVIDGDRHVVFTGSDVLIGQMKQYGDHLPFLATVRKIDRYYTLS